MALTDVAQFLELTAQSIADTNWDDEEAVEALEARTDNRYEAVLPDDKALENAFRGRLAERSEAFKTV